MLVAIERDLGGIVCSKEGIPLLANTVVMDRPSDIHCEWWEENHSTYRPAVLHDMKEFYDKHRFVDLLSNDNESPVIDFCWEPYYIHEDMVTAKAVPINIT